MQARTLAILLIAPLIASIAVAPSTAADHSECDELIPPIQKKNDEDGRAEELVHLVLTLIDLCGGEEGSETFSLVGSPVGSVTSTASPTVASLAGLATTCGGGAIQWTSEVTTTVAFREQHRTFIEPGAVYIERTGEGLWRMTGNGDVFGFESLSDGKGWVTIRGQRVLATAGSVTPFCLTPGDGVCGGDGFARHDGAFSITVKASFSSCRPT